MSGFSPWLLGASPRPRLGFPRGCALLNFVLREQWLPRLGFPRGCVLLSTISATSGSSPWQLAASPCLGLPRGCVLLSTISATSGSSPWPPNASPRLGIPRGCALLNFELMGTISAASGFSPRLLAPRLVWVFPEAALRSFSF